MPRLECCGEEQHLFDKLEVGTKWVSKNLACLFVGESPGSLGSPHFYTPIPEYKSDPIEVRRYLLPALSHKKIISSPSLEAFRDKGFLFDHTIRCQLATQIIENERTLARKHMSRLAHAARHLIPLLNEAPKVWIIGFIALDAVTHFSQDNLTYIEEIPKEGRIINQKYFLSHYLRRFDSHEKIQTIVDRFESFLIA
ncbi:MAG: hypothetical protein NPIRA03_09690 [Nitrospirales bacterium]|nr:MAG: hypothetical protein NPIRA03_09690 [Nitrospirales bacterium]